MKIDISKRELCKMIERKINKEHVIMSTFKVGWLVGWL